MPANPLMEKMRLVAQAQEPKPEEIYVRGIYLSAPSIAKQSSREAYIKLIDSTDLNAVVFDIKDATGYVFYQSNLPEVTSYEARKPVIKDLAAIVKELHEHNIYVIARQVVFLDPVLAKARPEWGVIRKGGGVWANWKGEKWADPTVKEVWDYNLEIAQEAIDAGIDEINFDYVRFPSDGPMSLAQYHNQFTEKKEVLNNFFAYLKDNLKDEPAYVSADLFGLTLDHSQVPDEDGNLCDNDLNIGQCLPEAAKYLDYVYPMAYASHYPTGYLGLANPAQYPYEVISHGLKKALPAMNPEKPQIRVWLQAFNLGAVYGIDKIREQIKATEESPTTQGWVLWNARNVYNYY